ncbi:MAG: BON domain-containing protein [Methylococcales bacterium]
MNKRLSLVMLTLISSLIMMSSPIRADQVPDTQEAANSALENSEQNVRDQHNKTLTPEDQKETKTDIRITTHIRKTIVKDKSLSVNAQNVKIITRNGVVTLRGPVETKAESKKLHKIAKKTRGVVQIDNQLEHKAP